jgi:hypothetical protein
MAVTMSVAVGVPQVALVRVSFVLIGMPGIGAATRSPGRCRAAELQNARLPTIID